MTEARSDTHPVPDHVQLSVAPDEEGMGGHLVQKSNKRCYFILYDCKPGSTDERIASSHLAFEPAATPEAFAEALATGCFDAIRSMEIDERATKMVSLGDVSRLQKLQTLSIGSAKYTGWSDIYGLTALKTLQLGPKVKGALPEGISALRDLEELSIQRSAIVSLPEDLGELKLARVMISSKKLTSLPRLNVDALEKLSVEAPLTEIDPALARVPKLSIYCKPAVLKKLSDAEREAFGDRIHV